MRKKILFLILILFILIGIFVLNKYVLKRVTDVPDQVFDSNVNSNDKDAKEEFENNAPAMTTYVSNRRIIWAMDFLPDGRMIFTERGGKVNVVEIDGRVEEIFNVDVYARGESGLHGVAIDPDFNQNNFVYLYYTYRSSGSNTLNRVSRFVFNDGVLNNEKIIVDEIPGASTHDGGRLKFGSDSFLYITTGDAQEPTRSQDKNSLAGKILRVDIDGEPALGNPFNTRIYSYGHRNPQGIAWDNQGRLWATEHGPSTRDELNLIETGVNYGWPEITGDNTINDMRKPVVNSGQNTWAPAGAEYLNGSIFFAGLRGSALYEYNIEKDKLTVHLKDKLGRIRDVILGGDGFLYVATSNHDGRGIPLAQDDRIIKINPLKLGEI